MQKNKKIINVRILAFMALMSAFSVIFGKLLSIPIGNYLRFGLENTPILFVAFTLGPVYAALTGCVADLLGCLVVGYEINPIITVGAMSIGLVGGLLYKLLSKMPRAVRISLSVVVAHIIGSLIIKTAGLYTFYKIPIPVLLLWRSLNYLVVSLLDIAVIVYLTKSKQVMAQIKKIKDSSMNYTETLEYIHSVSWTFCKPGLERIAELCASLGNPQNELKFIHVAGTNGKGSFCSMLSSVLEKSGYRVGLFTSPYVKKFNERMQINGVEISEDELIELTEKIKPICEGMKDKPTEFELITAIGFEYFKRHKCDLVVLECGLGGRLDSTNIVENVLLSVITGIALDHTGILGDTVEKIAKEKAGIIKKGTPCLYCGDDESAYEVIKQEADKEGAPLYRRDRSALSIKQADLTETVFDYGSYKDIKIRLLGTYQPKNASNVLSAIDILNTNADVSISEESIREGLLSASWMARFEKISDTPLIIFDGGHNPQGVDSAVESVRLYFGDEGLNVLTGVMADKDYTYMAEKIAGVASRVYTVTPNNPRALSAEEYSKVYKELGVSADAFDSLYDALLKAIEDSKNEGKALLILGSLYMYSEIISCFEKINQKN